MACELIEAIQVGKIEKAKQLIEASENLTALINEKDEEGNTALHWAVEKGLGEIITTILQKYKDGKIDRLELANNDGDTPLHEAAFYGHTDVVTALLDSGLLKPDELNNDKFTPLHEAACNNKVDVITLLLNRGADINAQASDGWTPLHCASGQDKGESVKVLLQHGANASLKTNNGRTALEDAKTRTHLKAKKAFEDHALNQKKAKAIKGLKLAALLILSIAAAGSLVISIGALAGWGVMVSLLSFAPWLAIALPAAIAGIAVIGLLAYGIHRLISSKQEQVKALDDLAHSGKQRLLGGTTHEEDGKMEKVLGDKSRYQDKLANPSTDPTSSSANILPKTNQS